MRQTGLHSEKTDDEICLFSFLGMKERCLYHKLNSLSLISHVHVISEVCGNDDARKVKNSKEQE
jgi:hypothetical protein